jgi:hypothetical protein
VSAVDAASAASLTIQRSSKLVAYNTKVGISGRLSTHSSGKKIRLQESRFPFGGGYHTIAHTQTGAGGVYRFTPTGTIATHYRTVLARDHSVKSPIAKIFVVPKLVAFRCNYCAQTGHNAPNGPGRFKLRISFKLVFPAGVGFASRKIHVYFALRKGTTAPPATLNHRKKVSQQQLSPNRSRVVIRIGFHAPAGPYSFGANFCGRDHYSSDGLGLPGHHRCGDASIPNNGEYLG